MKNLLYYLFFVYSLNCFAQKNCKIVYGIEVTSDVFEEEDPDMHGYDKKINEAMKTHASDFSFILKINDSISHFEPVNIMATEKNSFSHKMASSILQSKNKYYVNTRTQEKLTETEGYGQKFIIRDSISSWQLSKERKYIGKYVCYKATTKKVVVNLVGEFITNVVAWYTMDLPYSHGPIGYAGLPGLILELQDGVVIYKLEKINYVNKITVNKPEKGVIVTNEELLDYAKKASESKGW